MKFDFSRSLRRANRGRAAVLAAALLGAAILPACLLHPRRNTDLGANVGPGDQPDKVLYEKATREIDKGRYDVGRLTLQVLINTYPDSEYLSKAKLLTADSYYKQGGISGFTQAEAEYKDFITFFPTAPEAPEAQFRVGMAHFRLMGKPDRDLTEARAGEAEFKTFLEKYPDNGLVPTVKGRLREVQEVLAQGDYETALLYYRKGANRAAGSRFQEIADSYPDFSQADQALLYLGQSEERLRKPNEAGAAYDRVLTDYPLSPSVRPARRHLVTMHRPIPRPTKATLARARADRAVSKQVDHSLMGRLEGTFTGAPDFSATRHGPVRLGEHPAGVEQAQVQAPSLATARLAVRQLPDAPSTAGESAGMASAPAGSGTSEAAPTSSTDATPAASAGSVASPAGAAAAGSSRNKPQAGPQAGTPPSARSTKNSSDIDPDDSSSDKKKGKLHFLKKLFPF